MNSSLHASMLHETVLLLWTLHEYLRRSSEPVNGRLQCFKWGKSIMFHVKRLQYQTLSFFTSFKIKKSKSKLDWSAGRFSSTSLKCLANCNISPWCILLSWAWQRKMCVLINWMHKILLCFGFVWIRVAYACIIHKVVFPRWRNVRL